MARKPPQFPKHGSDLRALLTACHREPDGDTPRLVLADWLQEHDDPRAELVRLQVRLAAMPADDPEYDTLFEQHQRWWKQHGKVWEQAAGWRYTHSIICDIGPHNRGLPVIGCNKGHLAMLELHVLEYAIGNPGGQQPFGIADVIAEGWPEIIWVSIRPEYFKKLEKLSAAFDESPWTESSSPIGVCFESGEGVSVAMLERVAAIPNLRGVVFPEKHVSARLLPRLAKMTQLEYLDLGYVDINDDRMKMLGSLSGLRTLRLWPDRLTDSGMKTLAKLPELRELVIGSGGRAELACTGFTASTFKAINKLTKLEVLTIPGISDRQIRYLCDLPRLRELDLEGATVSGRTIADLFPRLTHLDLGNTNADNDDLAYIGEGLPRLRKLNLWETPTGPGLAELGGLKWLEDVTVTGTQVGDEAVPHLAALPSLQSVRLDYSQMTQAGVMELEHRLKDVRVFGGYALNTGHGGS